MFKTDTELFKEWLETIEPFNRAEMEYMKQEIIELIRQVKYECFLHKAKQ